MCACVCGVCVGGGVYVCGVVCMCVWSVGCLRECCVCEWCVCACGVCVYGVV